MCRKAAPPLAAKDTDGNFSGIRVKNKTEPSNSAWFHNEHISYDMKTWRHEDGLSHRSCSHLKNENEPSESAWFHNEYTYIHHDMKSRYIYIRTAELDYDIFATIFKEEENVWTTNKMRRTIYYDICKYCFFSIEDAINIEDGEERLWLWWQGALFGANPLALLGTLSILKISQYCPLEVGRDK